MPKATTASTPKPLRPATPAEAGAAPPWHPSIFGMACRVRQLTDLFNALDERNLALTEEDDHSLGRVMDTISDQRTALQDLAMSLKAETIADAAAQAAFCRSEAEVLSSSVMEEGLRLRKFRQIMRSQASILLLLCEMGGLDINTFGWGDVAASCGREFTAESGRP